jgi:hypothetical protein
MKIYKRKSKKIWIYSSRYDFNYLDKPPILVIINQTWKF